MVRVGKPECQRVINARNSFLGGGAATGERSSHPNASQSAHAEEMQEMELRRESQLDKNPRIVHFLVAQTKPSSSCEAEMDYIQPSGKSSFNKNATRKVRLVSALPRAKRQSH
jgi:hypothetical protein